MMMINGDKNARIWFHVARDRTGWYIKNNSRGDHMGLGVNLFSPVAEFLHNLLFRLVITARSKLLRQWIINAQARFHQCGQDMRTGVVRRIRRRQPSAAMPLQKHGHGL
jgi:hypothetical protein